MQLLLKASADPAGRDKDGQRPLDLALAGNHELVRAKAPAHQRRTSTSTRSLILIVYVVSNCSGDARWKLGYAVQKFAFAQVEISRGFKY